jgi:DNA ligase (NAD+)
MTDLSSVQKLCDIINQHAFLYYTLDAPIIDDDEYDILYRKLQSIEEASPELLLPDSPTQRVGGPILTAFGTVNYTSPMLSLGNAFDEKDIQAFVTRCATLLNQTADEIEFVCEPKMDGLAFTLRYVNGLLDQAGSRGDGLVGEDITSNCKTINDIPLRLVGDHHPEFVEIRGEGYMGYKSFDALNELAKINGTKPLVNQRNAAAGAMRKLDSKECAKRNLSFFAYSIGDCSEDNLAVTQYELLTLLQSWGFKMNPNTEVVKGADGVIKHFKELGDKRSNLPFCIDGDVVKLNNLADQDEMGFTNKEPKGQVAIKFPAEQKTTTLLDAFWSVGKTGVLVPNAVLEPVFVGGVTVTASTLHNEEHIKRLGLKVGQTVWVARLGDVVPSVRGFAVDCEDGKPIVTPKTCPVCDSPVAKLKPEDVFYYCTGSFKCKAQTVRSIQHFVGRDYMNIDSVGDKLIEALHESGKLNSIADIYDLVESDISELDRKAEKSAKNAIASIEKSKKTTLKRFLAALSIRKIGRTASEDLMNHFVSLENIKKASKEEFMALDNFGPISADYLYNFFRDEENLILIKRMMDAGVHWEETEQEIADEQPLSGQTWVVTGTLPSMSRDEAKDLLKKLGAKVSGSVSKNTTKLLAGVEAGSKLKKAQDLGVEVVGEEVLAQFI